MKNNNDNIEDSNESSESDPRRQALKLKTFRHFFSSKDIGKGVNKKAVLSKLKKSKDVEASAHKYIQALAEDPTMKIAFPWDSLFRRASFWAIYWIPRVIKWGVLALLTLFIVNYIPGPSQHLIELFAVRAIYDTASLSRLPDNLESYAHSAKIVGAQGTVIKSYGKRKVTAQIPEKAKKAIMACEDHYFMPHRNNPWYVNAFLVHPGVSWVNLVGAVKDTLGGNTRGASTLVMQNAKKILGNDKRTIANKFEEIIIAYMMVSKFGKDKCLDFYINTVPVGSNIYGFQAAARNYFKKDLTELNYQQLVAIGSFIPNHNRKLAFYDIAIKGKDFGELSEARRFHAKSAVNKINLALAYLRGKEEISQEEYLNWFIDDEESIRRIGFRNFSSPLYGKEQWTSWNVVREVTSRNYNVNGRKISGSELLLDEKGDVVIETGVDLAMVEQIKQIIAKFLNSPDFEQVLRKRNKQRWQQDLEVYRRENISPPYYDFEGFMKYLFQHINVGVVAINRKGEIIAYIGGKEFWQTDSSSPSGAEAVKADSNNATKIIIDLLDKNAKFAPSSTIKPIISYYNMVTHNTDLQATYVDKPLEYKYVESAGKELWLPRNWYRYNERGQGRNRYLGRSYSLLEAQVISVNTIFARMYNDRLVRNAMLLGFDEIGLDYNREEAKSWPFGIGSSDVPVQKWLGLYNAFLDGKYRQPSFVKRIVINGASIYERQSDPEYSPIPLFEADQERKQEMMALYEICNRGTASGMKSEFKYYTNLVSGKTGTAPQNKSALFIGHFNPYQDRDLHPDETITMLVTVTTNTGGMKSVGSSGDGPVKIAGKIFDHLFDKEIERMVNKSVDHAKRSNADFRNNHLYMANVNKYAEHLLHGKCQEKYIFENIIGVDGHEEALGQILNTNNAIYQGKDDLFIKLVEYYCDEKIPFKTKSLNLVPLKHKIKIN